MNRVDLLKKEITKALEAHYDSSPIYFEILLEVPLLWQGWELDEKGYIVTTSRNQTLFLNSDHGILYVDTKSGEFLKEKIEQYKSSQDISKKALELLKGTKKGTKK